MNANQADAKVATMCRVLAVSTSGYYAWRDRAPSARALADAVLTERIRAVHIDSHHTYGMPRARAELIDQGVTVSRKRVARLMRSHGIRGISRRRGFTVTTRRSANGTKAPDLVQRKFEADGPNQLWVADMTYVPTWAGFVYLAVVLDAWSRRVVGWAIGETMAVTLAAGNRPNLTFNWLESIQTMTAYIVEVSQGDTPAGTVEYRSIFAVGLALFVTTMCLNVLAQWFVARVREKYE